ncbi:unnamed protein product [Camellia sinensis]
MVLASKISAQGNYVMEGLLHERETCQRDHSTVMQRSLNFRLRCLSLWALLSTHFTAIKISSLGNIFGMVVNIFVYGGHVLV